MTAIEIIDLRIKEYKDSIHTEMDQYDYGYLDALKEVRELICQDI